MTNPETEKLDKPKRSLATLLIERQAQPNPFSSEFVSLGAFLGGKPALYYSYLYWHTESRN